MLPGILGQHVAEAVCEGSSEVGETLEQEKNLRQYKFVIYMFAYVAKCCQFQNRRHIATHLADTPCHKLVAIHMGTLMSLYPFPCWVTPWKTNTDFSGNAWLRQFEQVEMANLMRAEMLDELEACSPELKRMLAPIMLLGDSGISLGIGEKGFGNVREI